MELLIALGIIAFIIMSLGIIIKDSIINNSTYDNTPLLITILILNIIVIPCLIYSLKSPKAIDVYQGNTTLEITYKDSMPIDSVVVWKNR